MQTIDFYSVEAALNCLNICYRKWPWRNGALYFCTSSATGLTFDLSYGADGRLLLWRFIGVTSAAKAGVRYEYCDKNHSHTTGGIEVTDDGDIRLYVRSMVDRGNPESDKRIPKIISSYVNFITKVPPLSAPL